MWINQHKYKEIIQELNDRNITLVAVSKTKPVEAIQELYDLGHRDFGENYVQELIEKENKLPKDIRWHFIGHLQTNKVKYIAPFVHLIHGVDSWKLLAAINKQGVKLNKSISVLLQMHIAQEETKFGMDEAELENLIADLADHPQSNILIKGLMGMASLTDDPQKTRSEFKNLKNLFDTYRKLKTSTIRFDILSMGMSGDYLIAAEEGSNMVRIGSLLFGNRVYQ
jgi:pyridoxal phosphate enzyme (YggS family)